MESALVHQYARARTHGRAHGRGPAVVVCAPPMPRPPWCRRNPMVLIARVTGVPSGTIADDRPRVTCRTSAGRLSHDLPQDRPYVATTRLHSKRTVMGRRCRVSAEIMTGSRSAFAWTDRGVMRSARGQH